MSRAGLTGARTDEATATHIRTYLSRAPALAQNRPDQ